MAQFKDMVTFTFRQDAEGYYEIISFDADGWSSLWDVRFSTKVEADAAVETCKRRQECRKAWGLVA